MFSGSLSNNIKTVISREFYILLTTVTVNLFELLEILPGICLAYRKNCFPSILVWPIQIHNHFRQCLVDGFFHNSAITVNLCEILETLPGIYLTCAIKCFLSILVWPIQIYHYYLAMFSGSLSNNIKQ